jgi:hypothetical protein
MGTTTTTVDAGQWVVSPVAPVLIATKRKWLMGQEWWAPKSLEPELTSYGSWSDDHEGLDQFLEWNRRQRKIEPGRIRMGKSDEKKNVWQPSVWAYPGSSRTA